MVKVVVTSVSGDIVGIEASAEQGERVSLMKNEVVYLCSANGERLAAELLKVRGNRGTVQVFEDTRGLAVGDSVELTGEMLSVELGPGLLAQVYDGLQNPLKSIDERYGIFLPRGAEVDKLDRRKKWSFTPLVDAGVK
jgi:V/A-type H+-transporting ATPase subunit A